MASFGDLNEDILISIFKFLEVVELFKYSIVCKRWNRVIGNSNLLWKRFIPKCDSFDLPFNKNPKVVAELIYRRSEKFEEEYWYPDACGELENRDSELRGMLLTKDPNADEYAGFKLFARLNPIYDLINGCKYSETDLDQNVCNKAGKEKPTSACFGFVKALWKEFNQENQSDIVAETLESEKDVWNKSYVIGARHFLYVSLTVYATFFSYNFLVCLHTLVN